MDFFKPARRTPSAEPLPPHKRISTPAGERLSVILENGDALHSRHLRDSHRSSLKEAALGGGATPRESCEDTASVLPHSIWSDGGPPPPYQEKLYALRNNRHVAKRGGAGGGIGGGLVEERASESSSSSSHADSNAEEDTSSPGNTSTMEPRPSGAPSPTATNAPSLSSSIPSNPDFPVGSYTIQTFLDTVQTNCTANPLTWTCFPYTIYNDSPTQSLTSFNWIISRRSSSSSASAKYQISSTDNSFAISFSNVPLTLLDKDEPSERYRFGISLDRELTPSGAITDDGAATTCIYRSTSFHAQLYTEMPKDYPEESGAGGGSYGPWPYALRIEQVVGGVRRRRSVIGSGMGWLGRG
ncbi:hypothetical protein H2199_004020 [Coniosporium tulheliwenetii]|uniref:Uncharacterized protein n=1 Tax=Coniosporium tulheliwenetii TaxID=3383036 RepID=A0ACC2Z8T2_9PEZI|nr:hypothetical protein H2199_004020 [Cladosporium sp. JES 115]